MRVDWAQRSRVFAVVACGLVCTTTALAQDRKEASTTGGLSASKVRAPASASPSAGVFPLPKAPPKRAAAPTAEKRESAQRVLVLDVKNNGVDANAVKTLANMLVLELSRIDGIDVLSGEDVRRMVELEVGRAQAGCTDESCVAEIADAMGATVVVFGNAGRIGRMSVFNLSLFDTSAGRSLSRTSIKTSNLEEIPDRLTLVMEEFVLPLIPKQRKAKVRAKLIQRSQKAAERLAAPKKVKINGNGMLVVRTNPPGAVVSVDGREIGPAPVTVEELSEGTHFLEASAGDWIASQKVQVTPGAIERIELRLQKEPVRVVVVTSPPDATVFIDGERSGVAPLVLPSLSSGEHTFRAILVGHAAATSTLTLSSDIKDHRVELKLEPNAAETKRCVDGAVATNCGALASQAWELDDKASANAIWEVMCKRGNGNVCAFLAIAKIEKRPDLAQQLAKQGCEANYGPACDLLAALANGSRDEQTLAAEAVAKASAGFTGFKVADYSYTPSNTLCRDQQRCHSFCAAGLGAACRRESAFIRSTLNPAATPEEKKTVLLNEVRALKAGCALDDTESCDAILARDAALIETTPTTSTAALVFAPFLGVPSLGFLLLSGYAGTAAGALGAFFVLSEVLSVGTSEDVVTPIAIGAMIGGGSSAFFVGGGLQLLVNAVALGWGKAALLTGISLAAGIGTAVVAGTTSVVMLSATDNTSWLALSLFSPGLGAVVGGLTTAIAAPFILYEEPAVE